MELVTRRMLSCDLKKKHSSDRNNSSLLCQLCTYQSFLDLSHEQLVYYSRGFLFSNRLKSAYDHELLALVLALRKHYLSGRHFFCSGRCPNFFMEHRFSPTRNSYNYLTSSL
ncbi:unnamed protein product [Cuscuta campestris]|uniref:Uncharacterized protein n=1 Tax=Cuscuta campestris TaxID=132261 RepID=A0A484K256_9ASTE|nr:unnamed protein product [Cuscuta campestris]